MLPAPDRSLLLFISAPPGLTSAIRAPDLYVAPLHCFLGQGTLSLGVCLHCNHRVSLQLAWASFDGASSGTGAAPGASPVSNYPGLQAGVCTPAAGQRHPGPVHQMPGTLLFKYPGRAVIRANALARLSSRSSWLLDSGSSSESHRRCSGPLLIISSFFPPCPF